MGKIVERTEADGRKVQIRTVSEKAAKIVAKDQARKFPGSKVEIK